MWAHGWTQLGGADGWTGQDSVKLETSPAAAAPLGWGLMVLGG